MMGNAIGFGQGETHLPDPTCNMQVQNHVAHGVAGPRAGVCFVNIAGSFLSHWSGSLNQTLPASNPLSTFTVPP